MWEGNISEFVLEGNISCGIIVHNISINRFAEAFPGATTHQRIAKQFRHKQYLESTVHCTFVCRCCRSNQRQRIRKIISKLTLYINRAEMQQQHITLPNSVSAFTARPKHRAAAFAARERLVCPAPCRPIIQHLLHDRDTTFCLWIFLCAGHGSASSLTPSIHSYPHSHSRWPNIDRLCIPVRWVRLSILL